MNVSIERTDDAIWIKLPPETEVGELQRILDYFEYLAFTNKNQVDQKQIDELAREVNKGWWNENKHRFLGKEGFEGIK